MDERERLSNGEAQGWAEMLDLVDRLTPGELERPGDGPEGWSAKDVLWHMRAWTEEAARQLGRIRTGTYVERDWGDTDELNAAYLAEGRATALDVVRTELERSRARLLAEWAWVTELSEAVVEWFGESGQEHYAEHLPPLRAFVERVGAGRDPDPAPRRAAKLAAERAAWTDLTEVVEALPPDRMEEPGVTPDGWSGKDTLWHIAKWCEDTVGAFGRMREGTFGGEWQDEAEVEAMNRRWFEESRTLEIATVRDAWIRARREMVEAFARMPAPGPVADEWFDETGTVHYEKHLIDLRPWLAAST